MNPAASLPDNALDDARWRTCLARDGAADGTFVFAVRTTGIYCRPSCPGRPKRENVQFFASAIEARTAGFRACKRCNPDKADKTGWSILSEVDTGSREKIC